MNMQASLKLDISLLRRASWPVEQNQSKRAKLAGRAKPIKASQADAYETTRTKTGWDLRIRVEMRNTSGNRRRELDRTHHIPIDVLAAFYENSSQE